MITDKEMFETLETIGLNLYVYRMRRKLSIETVAADVLISSRYLTGIEDGRYPGVKISHLWDLCQFYGLPLMAAFEFC